MQDPSRRAESDTASPVPLSAHEAILRHRKPRQTKACHPCRFRKLKCDFNVPCERCIARGHPDLCNVPIPPRKKQPIANSARDDLNGDVARSGGRASTASDQQYTSPGNDSSLDPADDLNHPTQNAGPGPAIEQYPSLQDEGICQVDDMTGGLIFLGSKSRPAFVQAYWKAREHIDDSADFLDLNVVSVFCLNNYSATYPFVNFWASNRGDFDLYNTLPTDTRCMRYYRNYRDYAYPLYPALLNMNDFESQLCDFLLAREGERVIFPQGHEESVHGKTWAWIGLLFAVLASGCQFSDLPPRDRELTTRVYVCCSFECLRIVNFFLRPSLETIQTMALMANISQNHSNPGIAWSLVGMNVRLAETIGLHMADPLPHINESLNEQRKQCWRMIAWQDSSLSLAFDRDPITALKPIHLSHPPTSQPPRQIHPTSSPTTPNSPGESYFSSMDALCALTLSIQNKRLLHLLPINLLPHIPIYLQHLDDIFSRASPHLKDKSQCQSLSDRLQHIALRIQISYIGSELTRPFLFIFVSNGQETEAHIEQYKAHALACREHLKATINASLELHRLSPIASRSWDVSYRTISSALVLAVFGDLFHEPNIRTMLIKYVRTLEQLVDHEAMASDQGVGNKRDVSPGAAAAAATLAGPGGLSGITTSISSSHPTTATTNSSTSTAADISFAETGGRNHMGIAMGDEFQIPRSSSISGLGINQSGLDGLGREKSSRLAIEVLKSLLARAGEPAEWSTIAAIGAGKVYL